MKLSRDAREPETSSDHGVTIDELLAGVMAAASFAAILQVGGTLDPKKFDPASNQGWALCGASFVLSMSVIEVIRLRWHTAWSKIGARSIAGLIMVVVAILLWSTANLAALLSIGWFLSSVSERMTIWYCCGFMVGMIRVGVIWAARRL